MIKRVFLHISFMFLLPIVCLAHWDGECTESLHIEPTNGQTYLANFTIDHSCSEPNNPDRFHCHRWTLDGQYHSHGYWSEAGYEGAKGSANPSPCLADRTEPEPEPEPEPPPNPPPSRPSTPTTSPQQPSRPSTSSGSTSSGTSATRPSTPRTSTTPETIVLPSPDEEIDPPDDTSAIDDPVEEVVEPEPVELVRFVYGAWHKGHNLVSFPVMRPEIETLSDFYNHYSFMESPDDVLYVVIDGDWYAYNGQDDQIAGDIQITPYLGVLAVMDWSIWWALTGSEIIGDGAVELSAGLNVVGLSELPSRYQLPSDFLGIDGVEMVMVTGWDDVEKTNRLYIVGRAGDPGDTPLYLGQAVILITSEAVTLDMSEPAPAAPMAQREGTLATSWGAMKRR